LLAGLEEFGIEPLVAPEHRLNALTTVLPGQEIDEAAVRGRLLNEHGIEISAKRVRKVIQHFDQEKERTRAWRRILEQTTGALLRQSEDA
jgi:aspartate aminotransferase-like enzyme